MYASPLDSLIETLVESIQADAAAIRERHVLRQALLGLVRQAQVEQAAQARVSALWLSGMNGFGKKTPQHACRH